MNAYDSAMLATLLLSVGAVVLFALAVIITAWRNGSLQSDLRWIRRTMTIRSAHATTWLHNN